MAEQEYFTVHTVTQDNIEVTATTESGRAVIAHVPGLVVELVPEGHTHGTITRRYMPDNDDDLELLKKKYVQGARVTVTIDIAEKQPEAKKPMAPEIVTFSATQAPAPATPPIVASNLRTQATAVPTAQERDAARLAKIAEKSE